MGNPICELLNIRYPIFQGAMTNVSDVSLVSAVSNAGGLGIFAPGIENVDLNWVREQIRAIRAATPNTFGVNVMLASPYTEDIVGIVCEEKVPVVTTGAGSPAKYMEKLHGAGIKVIPVVSSKDVAVKMEAAGADALVASGMEAGGYVGRIATMPLIPAVVDAVSIPVVAAGGFYDGRGLAAAMMLGACGVQMGTRFLTVAECAVPDWCKEALVAAGDKDVVLLGSRIGAKACLRTLATAGVKEIQAYESREGAAIPEFEKAVTALRVSQYDNGLPGTLIAAGQVLSKITDRPTAKELIESIVRGYNTLQKKPL